MTNWTAEKSAHLDTWFSLLRLGQIRKPFNISGKIKMSELTYYDPTVSKDSFKVEVALIAHTIDNVLTSYGAKLKNNISRKTALNNMIKVLLNKEKTILDLAEINNENYFYENEIR
ncbi:hypothetical protein MM239_18480 [Belliella sp. DSM 111904]|uniref:Uncharacterized protein n=1 Tax=Belliella filtrata TaxID=2923435 RepID=A0ABS9V4P6_9BACT|nr:hypothetical protein [Belliella filtrata]MCH7411386.1 hypothetical protein [Belliella filtrata]